MDAIDFLKKFSDFIEKADIFSWLVSYPKWWITMGLYKICSVAEGFINTAFDVFSFINSGKVAQLYNGFKYVSWTVLAITLGFIGFKMIMGKNVKVKDTLFHIIIMGCLIVNLPGLMTSALKLNKTLYNQSKNLVVANSGAQSSGDNTLAFNLIKTNVADLEYLAYNGYDKLGKGDSVKNNLTAKTLKFADLHQILTPKDIKQIKKDSDNKEVENLQKYVTLNAEGKTVAKEIKNGWFSMFEEGTFRYNAKFGLLNVSFIVLSIFYFMQFCKLIIMVIDLVQVKIYAPLVLASDIETGKKAKQMIIDIMTSLFTIASLGISTVLFNSFYAYLVGLKLNPITFFLVGVIGAVGFIKGSDSVAKYFGINTSVKDGILGAMAGLAALKAGQMAISGAEAVGGKVEKAKDLGKKSYQQASQSVQKGASKAGETIGQFSQRGAGGFAKDLATNGVNSVGNKAKKMSDKMTQPLKNAKSNFNDGINEGLSKGHSGNASEDNQKRMDDIARHDVDSAQNINKEPVRFNDTENRSSGRENDWNDSTEENGGGSELNDSNELNSGGSELNSSTEPTGGGNDYQSEKRNQLPPLEERATSTGQKEKAKSTLPNNLAKEPNSNNRASGNNFQQPKDTTAGKDIPTNNSSSGEKQSKFSKEPKLENSIKQAEPSTGGPRTSFDTGSSGVGQGTVSSEPQLENTYSQTEPTTGGPRTSFDTGSSGVGQGTFSSEPQLENTYSETEPTTGGPRTSFDTGSSGVGQGTFSSEPQLENTYSQTEPTTGGQEISFGTGSSGLGHNSTKVTHKTTPTIDNQRASNFEASLPKAAESFVTKPTSNGSTEKRVDLSQSSSFRTQSNSPISRPKLETTPQKSTVSIAKPEKASNETFSYSLGSNKASKPNKYENYFKG